MLMAIKQLITISSSTTRIPRQMPQGQGHSQLTFPLALACLVITFFKWAWFNFIVVNNTENSWNGPMACCLFIMFFSCHLVIKTFLFIFIIIKPNITYWLINLSDEQQDLARWKFVWLFYVCSNQILNLRGFCRWSCSKNSHFITLQWISWFPWPTE